jgi:FMN reductase
VTPEPGSADPPAAPRTRAIAVVTAGLSTPSSTRLLADRLAAATADALGAHGMGSELRVVEARDHARDLVDDLLLGFASPALQAAIDGVTSADGLIAVTPIFSGSFSGLFKTLFDVLERDALGGMPVLLAATAGSARHSLAIDHALRPLFAYLGAATVPTGVFAAAGDWGSAGEDVEGGGLAARIERAARQLAEAIALRAPRPRADPFVDPLPFARLLAGDDPAR